MAQIEILNLNDISKANKAYATLSRADYLKREIEHIKKDIKRTQWKKGVKRGK